MRDHKDVSDTAVHVQAESRASALRCLRRGQFVLGPARTNRPHGWRAHEAAGALWVTAHPELPVITVWREARALTLIGFILDPTDPTADDAAILSKLLACCTSVRKLIAATAVLGGRWAMVAACDDGLYLLTDALGLRQAMHTSPAAAGDVWVVSQADLAADVLGLLFDPDAMRFIDSDVFRRHREYRWPGTSTALRGLRHLLPNHLLDLHTGRAARYWPDGPLPPLTLREGVERTTSLITGLMLAAAQRFELALSLTAGIDSRLVLAAARLIKDRIAYVSVRQAKMPEGAADVAVPARLLARLGLRHEIVRAAASTSADFSWFFKRSVFLAHDGYGPDAEAIWQWSSGHKVAVTGSGAEVGRCPLRDALAFSNRRRITAADLARLQHLEHPYAIRFFSEWIEDVGERAAYVKLLDLFEWEQGHGNGLAMAQLEFDIAWRDIFTPYNCRALLATFLSVDERFRKTRYPTLFRSAIEELWPEVLCEPINPGTGADGLRRPLAWLRHLRRLPARMP
ncbi:MAG: hypothetical protein ACJ8NR_19360 [Sulfurifustis sp.]